MIMLCFCVEGYVLYNLSLYLQSVLCNITLNLYSYLKWQ